MGWWSATIMGGDSPLDEQSALLRQAGLSWEAAYELPKHRAEIEQALPKMVEYAQKQKYDRDIVWQVLGVLLMGSGAAMPKDVQRTIIQAAKEDEWMKEVGQDTERGEHIQDFIHAVMSYNLEGGKPVELKREGLMDKINQAMDRNGGE